MQPFGSEILNRMELEDTNLFLSVEQKAKVG